MTPHRGRAGPSLELPPIAVVPVRRPHAAAGRGRAAIETFERLGARPWASRARNELRATGQSKPRVDCYAMAPLTAQEREAALLAASDLTNKQIAERLFLSPRTVGGHLHRVFPKLGIATRAALRDALASVPPGEDH
jgi:DNA-binding CsgD family transcriptional regulator